jgi:hypothetical protein
MISASCTQDGGHSFHRYADIGTRWSEAPWGYLSRDTDVEAAATSTGMMSQGRVMSVDDAAMGWSRYAGDLISENLISEV